MSRTRSAASLRPAATAAAIRAAGAVIRESEKARGRAMCGLVEARSDLYTNALAASRDTLQQRLNPPDVKAAFTACKAAWRDNLMLRALSRIKLAFLNYGLSIRVSAKEDSGWLEMEDTQPGMSNRTWVANFVRGVWRSRVHYDNVPVVWLGGVATNIPPTVVAIDRTRYLNEFGVSALEYTLPQGTVTEMAAQAASAGMSGSRQQQARAQRLQAKLKEALAEFGAENGVMLLDEVSAEKGRHFRVWTQAPAGEGYEWPSLHACMKSVEAYSGLEFGDLLLALACDRVIRFHRLGHEIKSGAYAGSQRNMWTEAQDRAVKDKLKGKCGLMEMSGNFDHQLETWYPGWEAWDVRRWEGVQQRINYWAGPVGLLSGITSGSRNPGAIPAVMRMLETEVVEDRQNLGPWIEETLEAALGIKLKIKWGISCFRDVRVWAEMLKLGLTAGPASQTTFQEATDLDPELELQRKTDELPQAKVRVPLTMPGHGKVTAGANGRPAGTRDPEGGMQ